ncbi:alpha/beta fold hydrolase [Arthrobacter sp. SDTb3-6]|uniref:alpha/beta fold hydrolase n=1 Tax=Arthrobacter sp. SDTb3-6 TaxID=2713571 RepID=UPI00159E9662|nr:alpha/beta hydrolase [Arthrobacter sp. SDTb3-6]NVM98226.1 alpha/beta fold hydrolase [Arthrobacter sp. SDTb3-6]
MAKATLVLLHGVGLDHTMWHQLAGRLGTQFDVRALDLLGHGTRPPAPADVTLSDLADDIAGMLEPGTHLVGFSLGALVGQHLASHRPGLLASLTSVSSVCRRTPEERSAVLARLALAAGDFPASVEASLERWFPDATAAPNSVVAQTRRVLLGNDVQSYLNCYRVFATADEGLSLELPKIAVPALAVTGADDPGSTPEMTHRLAGAMPDCTAVVVPHARHMLPVQDPEALATALTSFIGEKINVNYP